MTFVYTPPEPPAATLSAPDGQTLALYTETQLRSEVERVQRETVEACAKVCDLREHHIAALLEEQIKAAAVDSAKWFSSGVVSASRRNAQHIRELLK